MGVFLAEVPYAVQWLRGKLDVGQTTSAPFSVGDSAMVVLNPDA